MIRVYSATEKEFANNGMGTIIPLSCIEEKQISLNGWYIDVTADVSYADKLVSGNIVLAKTKEKGIQPFRIKSPDKTDKKISFRAHHVAFDTENYILSDVRPENLSCDSFIKYINERTDTESPFQVSGNAVGSATHYFIRKSLLEALRIMQEEEFDCLFDIDKFRIMCMAPSDVGEDEGYSVVYGKNIQGVKITENWNDVCTKVMPVGPNGLTIPELYVSSDTQYDIPYTRVQNFDINTENENGEEIPIEEQYDLLRESARVFLKEHSVPKISYNVQSDVPQELRINDTVYIKHPLVTISAHVQGYKFDCMSGRVKNLTFGNYDPNVRSVLQKEIIDAASSAAKETGNKVYKTLKYRIEESGGLYSTVETLDDGSEKTYLHNKKNLEESDIILTINDEGLFVSSDGGETWYGIEMGGAAFLRFLEAATISSEKIYGGMLSSVAKDANDMPVTYIDMDKGDVAKFGNIAWIKRDSGNESLKWMGET